MSVDAMSQLLSRWEELRRQGTELSAEELCADRPELVPELQRRMQALAAFDSILNIQRRQTPGKQLEDEIRTLLRSRLILLVALNLLVGLIYFGMVLSDPIHAPYSGRLDIVLAVVEDAISLGVLVVLVRGHWLTLRQLRGIEVVAFGLTALLLASSQYRWYHSGWLQGLMKEGQEGELILLAGTTFSFPWLLLVIIYGTSIPNTGRRCAAMVGALIVPPVLLIVVLALEDAPRREHLLRYVLAANMLIWLPFAAAIAIYGSHKLSVMRRQVVAARKLGQYRLLQRLGLPFRSRRSPFPSTTARLAASRFHGKHVQVFASFSVRAFPGAGILARFSRRPVRPSACVSRGRCVAGSAVGCS